MKNRVNIQVPKEVRELLKTKKLMPRETFGDMMKRTLDENEELKEKIRRMMKK